MKLEKKTEKQWINFPGKIFLYICEQFKPILLKISRCSNRKLKLESTQVKAREESW